MQKAAEWWEHCIWDQCEFILDSSQFAMRILVSRFTGCFAGDRYANRIRGYLEDDWIELLQEAARSVGVLEHGLIG